MLAMTQTRDTTGTSRSISSDMVIGVLPMLIMEHTPSTKVGASLLVLGWITHCTGTTAIRAEGFLEQIRFFTRLILNVDQSDSLE